VLQKQTYITLIIFCVFFFQPTPAHAGFFLFNIINDIFDGSDRKKTTESRQPASTAIKYGMKNNQVTAIQQYLIKAKYLGGTADGVFGKQTLQAVKEFQKDIGLVNDGVVGTRTMNALKTFKGTKPKASSRTPAYKPPHKDNGIPHYLTAIPMLATAYTRYDEGCTDYTYRGTYLRRGLTAVDPNIIPLGTKLYIPGYGEAIADDIGGAIQGNRIDLAMDTLDEAFSWGAKNITVYVLP
jgi:3D (Asp-Asp-Asp) domain-containing protein